MTRLPDYEKLQLLKCSSCSRYLSVGPIKHISINGYNCGRCPSEGNAVNTVFETLAAEHHFPCSFDFNGCKVELPYGEDVLVHEINCEYKPCSCLIDDNCGWIGCVKDTYSHCLEKHGNHILSAAGFVLNIQSELDVKMVKKIEEEILLVHLKYNNKDEDGLLVKIEPIHSNSPPIQYYDLSLTSKDTTSMSRFSKFKNGKNISKTILSHVDPGYVNVSLDIGPQPEVTNIVQELKSGLLCDLCKQKLSVYVVTCQNEHFFCLSCLNPDADCIICKAILNIKSNYDMMGQCRGAKFYCCHSLYDCTFSDDVTTLEKHEANCVVRKCPIDSCKWRKLAMNTYNLRTHLKKKHKLLDANDSAIIIKADDLNEEKDYNVLVQQTGKCFSNCRTINNIILITVAVDNDTVLVTANYIRDLRNKFIIGNYTITLGEGMECFQTSLVPLHANMTLNTTNLRQIFLSELRECGYFTITIDVCEVKCWSCKPVEEPCENTESNSQCETQ